jgi:hypothetical protein
MRKIVKLLSFLNITQEIVNQSGFTRRRLNPYNPLSYLTFVIFVFIVGMNGFISTVKESLLTENPFKYS